MIGVADCIARSANSLDWHSVRFSSAKKHPANRGATADRMEADGVEENPPAYKMFYALFRHADALRLAAG